MHTRDTIINRISANKFDPGQELSRQEIAELVDLATQAPSSFNQQNWRFVAVTRREDKARLKDLAYGQQKVADAAVTFIVLGDLRGYERLAQALEPSVRAGILGAAEVEGWAGMAAGMYADKRLARDEAVRSASLAAMTLMLAAQDRGLASGPMIGFDAEAVRTAFGIPERYLPVMLLPVGRAAAGNWPRKPRLKADLVLAFDSGAGL